MQVLYTIKMGRGYLKDVYFTVKVGAFHKSHPIIFSGTSMSQLEL